MSLSTDLFPIVIPIADTINEVNGSTGDAIYEALRLQFLLAGETFDERSICKTVCLFLKSALCPDQVVSYDGTEFQMSASDTDTPFQKVRRIYGLYESFNQKCTVVMIQNMRDVLDMTPATMPENIETRTRLVYKIARLEELKTYYLAHSNAIHMIEQIKYLI